MSNFFNNKWNALILDIAIFVIVGLLIGWALALLVFIGPFTLSRLWRRERRYRRSFHTKDEK